MRFIDIKKGELFIYHGFTWEKISDSQGSCPKFGYMTIHPGERVQEIIDITGTGNQTFWEWIKSFFTFWKKENKDIGKN